MTLKLLVGHANESINVRNRLPTLFFDFRNDMQLRNWHLSARAVDKNH
jgi:hypothetical protein